MKELLDISLPDGNSTKITIFQKEIQEGAPVAILFPAMGVAAAYYEPFAVALAEQKIIVVTADLRGLGHSSVRPSRAVNYGYEEMVSLDYQEIFKAIWERFPKAKKYVLGHSLGGQLACLFLGRYDFQVDGLVLLASCSVHPSGWKEKGQLRVYYALYFFPVLCHLLGYFPGDKVGFGGKAAKQHMLDWCHQGKTGRYEPANTAFDYEPAMKQLKLPLLTINIENDQMAPPLATRNLVEKLHPESLIQSKILTPKEANFPKLNHFNWGRHPEGMVKVISTWIQPT